MITNKDNDKQIIGDKSSYYFIKNLSYKPISSRELSGKIAASFFESPKLDKIEKDLDAFMSYMVVNGIVSCGITKEECDNAILASIGKDCDLSSLDGSGIESFNNDLRLKPALQEFIIQINNKCNERCIHCYIPHEEKNDIMSYEDFVRIVEMAKRLKSITEIKITGGEPMVHPRFKDIIRKIKNENFFLTVMTNLTLLDDEILDILAKESLSQLQTTIFSLDSKIHDKVTKVEGSLDKVLANIQKLKECGIKIRIATQAMECNKDSLPNLFEWCEKNGFQICCDWTIIAKENLDKSALDLRIKNFDDYTDLCRARMKYDKRYAKEMYELIHSPLRSKNAFACMAGVKSVMAGVDLNIYACPGWRLSCGDLRNSTLQEIWDNSTILKNIRNVRLSEYGKCAECDKRNICLVCQSQAYNEGEHYRMPEYTCNVYDVLCNEIKNIADSK